MKRIILILLGFIPLAIGFLMNSWMMKNSDSLLPFTLIGMGFLLIWALIGFVTANIEKTPLKAALTITFPGLIMLVLILFQELILRRYWFNIVGAVTQFYFLPLVNLSSMIACLLLFIPSLSSPMWFICMISYLLMFASYYFGARFKEWWD